MEGEHPDEKGDQRRHVSDGVVVVQESAERLVAQYEVL